LILPLYIINAAFISLFNKYDLYCFNKGQCWLNIYILYYLTMLINFISFCGLLVLTKLLSSNFQVYLLFNMITLKLYLIKVNDYFLALVINSSTWNLICFSWWKTAKFHKIELSDLKQVNNIIFFELGLIT
jgi:hypothetical protein